MRKPKLITLTMTTMLVGGGAFFGLAGVAAHADSAPWLVDNHDGTVTAYWLMPDGGTATNVTWPQTPIDPLVCGSGTIQVDTYYSGTKEHQAAIAALYADGVLSAYEDSKILKSYGFITQTACATQTPTPSETETPSSPSTPPPVVTTTPVSAPPTDTPTTPISTPPVVTTPPATTPVATPSETPTSPISSTPTSTASSTPSSPVTTSPVSTTPYGPTTAPISMSYTGNSTGSINRLLKASRRTPSAEASVASSLAYTGSHAGSELIFGAVLLLGGIVTAVIRALPKKKRH